MATIITLLLIALVLFFFEILLPGGILAIIGAALMLGASVVAYTEYGVFVALVVFLISAIIAVGMFFLELHLIRTTRLGKLLILDKSQTGTSSNAPLAENDIIGKLGEALTTMAPSGFVVIDGRKYEATSRSGMLEKGAAVKVIRMESFSLVVEETGS